MTRRLSVHQADSLAASLARSEKAYLANRFWRARTLLEQVEATCQAHGANSPSAARGHLAVAGSARDHEEVERWYDVVRERDVGDPDGDEFLRWAEQVMVYLLARPEERRPGFDPERVRAWLGERLPGPPYEDQQSTISRQHLSE